MLRHGRRQRREELGGAEPSSPPFLRRHQRESLLGKVFASSYGSIAQIPGCDIWQGGGPFTRGGSATVASKRLLDKFNTRSLHRNMKDLPDLTPAKRTERAAREERLAKALRDNLHRRKQQQRARDEQKVLQPQRPNRDREPLP